MQPSPRQLPSRNQHRPTFRRRLRATAMGLRTVLGLGRRGYFIPHRYAGDVPATPPHNAYPEIAAMLEARSATFAAFLDEMENFAEPLNAIGDQPPPAPRWAQGWFPRLDAAAAYTMVRTRRPSRVIEVGSGHSTRFMVRAARDAGIDVAFTAIDPAPRADLAGLGVAHIAATLQNTGVEPFGALTPGDILFIDSSHILVPGSDADLLINRVWPVLPKGVIVHIHDIFLPDGYPEIWSWRGYNEQNGIAPLLAGGGATALFASHYVVTRMRDRFDAAAVSRLPLFEGAIESSLWLEKAKTP